jgi:hypothetical protein
MEFLQQEVVKVQQEVVKVQAANKQLKIIGAEATSSMLLTLQNGS